MPDLLFRDATIADAEAMLAIYRPYVTGSAVSFELEPPSLGAFEQRIADTLGKWAWLVVERDRDVAGYAYASWYKTRAAYDWSVETAVYIHEDYRGQGVGKKLYLRLCEVLAERGYCTAYAGIALPNDASIRLHRAVGFSEIGLFRHAGWKFGRWQDVSWWQRELRDRPPSNDAASGVRPPPDVRRARPADIAGITACVCEAYAHYIERIGRQPAPMLQDYAEVIERDQVHVATAGGRILGVLVLAVTREGFCLDNVAVRLGDWGRGIGRTLLRLGEEEALRQGFTSIYLYTNEQMTEDRDLYTRIGYVQYDRRVVDGYTRIFFRKTLA